MRIKIVEKGWEGFSDWMGPVKFTNGISDDDVPEHVLNNIAGSIKVVEYREDGGGSQIGFAAAAVAGKNTPAPLDNAVIRDLAPAKNAAPQAPAPKVEDATYSYDDLAEIADLRGIIGLREVAAKFGVKGREITGLIRDIMKAQDRLKKQAADRARQAADRGETA